MANLLVAATALTLARVAHPHHFRGHWCDPLTKLMIEKEKVILTIYMTVLMPEHRTRTHRWREKWLPKLEGALLIGWQMRNELRQVFLLGDDRRPLVRIQTLCTSMTSYQIAILLNAGANVLDAVQPWEVLSRISNA